MILAILAESALRSLRACAERAEVPSPTQPTEADPAALLHGLVELAAGKR
jgi:hypothetical protein